MKVFLLLAMILPLALSTSRIAEMQVHTGIYPGSGIEFEGKNSNSNVKSILVSVWLLIIYSGGSKLVRFLAETELV